MSENAHIKNLRKLIGKSGKEVSPSPYMHWLNGELVTVSEGKAEIKFPIRDDMLNPAGILHGGVIAGMMDEVAGIGVYTLQKEYFYTSLNLNVDFLRPASSRSDVYVKSTVLRHGKRIIHVEVNLLQDNELKAKASSNLIILNTKIPQTFKR